mgnify:CR=1 FL=1
MIDEMLRSICLFIGFAYLVMNCKGDIQQLGSSSKLNSDTTHIPDTIRQAWSCSAPFEKVESVAYDQKRHCIYVSNGKDYGVGQDGFISKVSMQGEVIDLKWIENLNRPTGMAIYKDHLYVVDVNALLVLDLNLASVVDRLEVPIQYGINDVAIAEDGHVFVTASAIHAVLQVTEQGLVMWAQDEEHLQWANGIQALPKHLLVGGEHLVRLSIADRSLEVLTMEPKVRDFEGVNWLSEQTVLVSTVENSALYLIQHEKSRLLLQSDAYFGDLEYIPDLHKLIIAQGNHQGKTYQVNCYQL